MVNNIQLNQITHQELAKHLETELAAGETLGVDGDTGTGKSWAIELHARLKARQMGRKFFHWDLNEKGQDYAADRFEFLRKPELIKETFIFAPYLLVTKQAWDGTGIPVPDPLGCLDWQPDVLFHTMAQKGAAGLLFLDEFAQAPPPVQRGFSELLHSKRISGRVLSNDIGIVLASNRDKDKCGTQNIDEHIKARSAWYELMIPTAADWCKWATEYGIDSRIIMVIRSQPDLLHQEIEHRNSKEKAFPCGRQWHRLSNVIKPIDHVTQKSHFLQKVAARVGSGAAAKFQAILDHDMSERGPEVLDNPLLFQTEQWDRRIAFSLWLSHTAKTDESILRKGCAFLDAVPENDLLDTLVYMMRTNVGKPFAKLVRGTTKYKQLRRILRDLGEMMEV